MGCGGDEASSELHLARARAKRLQSELEAERLLRFKAESLSKALARELAEEWGAREEAEGARRRLEAELASRREEAERVAREVEEERRMLQIAEMWREERVKIKLLEAKHVMEEKLREMVIATSKSRGSDDAARNKVKAGGVLLISGQSQHGKIRREVENPHIKRGIKGYVEFPRVVTKACKVSRGGEGRTGLCESYLECQRAQLRILLRHKSSNGFVAASNLNFVN